MPGGIDPHVHCTVVRQARRHAVYTDGPERRQAAALYGGTTTLIDFARWTHGKTVLQAIEERDKDWVGQCHCDYTYHVMLQGAPPPEIFGQLAEAMQAGLSDGQDLHHRHHAEPQRPHGRFRRHLGGLQGPRQASGGLGVMHAEDNDIVMHMYDKLIREGRAGFENLAEVHNALSEDSRFRRVLRLAENVPGTALYFMHVTAGTGVAGDPRSARQGLPIYGETLHQYLLYTAEDYKRPNGQMYHTYPSLKSQADQDELWAGTLRRHDQHRRHRRGVLHACT